MSKDPVLSQLGRLLRHHWLVTLSVAFSVAIFGGVLWAGAPAWAAPVTRPLNQTVPRPTPVTPGNPVATATPRPSDDGDGSDSGGGSTGGGSQQGELPSQGDPSEPNITFPQGPGSPAGGANSAAPSLTAQVTTDGLNLREGPGTAFNTLGRLLGNSQVTVLSRSEDGTWWYICCLPDTETRGWVSAQLLSPDFDRAQANELIPIFGAEPTPAPATTVPTAQPPTAAEPLEIDFQIDPYFVWQGITATLTITVNNPNTTDALNVELSDELPEALTLLQAEADAGGVVETIATERGRSLLLFQWESIPADTSVTASIIVEIDAELPNGAVVDNLVATRANNAPYSADVVTLGMPPVVPPDFQ
jgi:uncharacterized repeat protein (TIGR01451 family)